VSRFAREEIANSITHGLGFVLSVGALPVLVWLAAASGDSWRIVSSAVYGTTLILLYASSTLYHAFRTPRVKRIFQIFDYAAIYLLIAGTYTPFTLVSMRGPWGWMLFGMIWALAIFRVVSTAVALNLSRYITPAISVAMGWLVLIAVKPLLAMVPAVGIAWLVAGGLAYTVGVIFFAWERLPYGHAIWHCFVLAGSVCHFTAVVVAVLPVAR
jgi:hemolysin III